MIAALLAGTAAFLSSAARAEPTPIRRPLSELPTTIGSWTGRVEPPLSKAVLDQLRADDYTLRSYVGRGGGVGLYIGYHATQRQGASIHSPLNCLPGAGWIPTDRGIAAISVPLASGATRAIEVNRIVIEKGLDRALVFYWYQSHGRVVASEYWGKFYGVVDAIRINRTDAALVRVTVPVDSPDGLERAEQRGISFVQAIFPELSEYLPS